jgi:hypothetical protein
MFSGVRQKSAHRYGWSIVNTNKGVDVRQFISWLKDDYEKFVSFRPVTLRPVELASLLEKLQGIYDVPTRLVTDCTVLVGSKVSLMNMQDFSEASFLVTLPQDSDPAEGKISVLSPLGSALLGQRRGEIISLFLGNTKSPFCLISVNQNP